MRKNSVKMIRINREFQRELSTLISMEVKDPRISPMTSVTRAEVATDLKTCKVYISTLGTDEEQEEAMRGLKSAAGFLRRQLAMGLNLRNTPELILIPDHSIEYGINMIRRIDERPIEEQNELRDYAFSVSAEVIPDSQGRIIIPQDHIEYAKIDSSVTIIGNDTYESIWASEVWAEREAATEADKRAKLRSIRFVPAAEGFWRLTANI